MKLKGSDFIESYINWLKSNIKVNEIKDYTEITTPFLDNHNDHIQIYVKQDKDKFIISDDGYIIGDLLMSGCEINSQRRKELLNTIINSVGVKLYDDELFIEANFNNFAQKKHMLIQAMLSVSDMFMLSQHRVASVFLEDVEEFLINNDIRYTPSIILSGKSGFSHTFDFIIPASKKRPERLIKAVNNPSKDRAQNILFSWSDIREVRKQGTNMIVFLNDYEKDVRSDVISAFSQYDISTILWSQRQNSISELAS